MKFYNSIGIKQVIRYEWMQHTVSLIKAGLNKEQIKKELEAYLSDKKGSGRQGNRSECTMSFVITILMNTWVKPKPALEYYRDKLLSIVLDKNVEPICHWSIISAVYPFWYNISYICGSLFKLQEQITNSQIMSRTYELLGEKNTIKRCSGYVIRSFAAWDIIHDKKKSGCYEQGAKIQITDEYFVSILFEALLYAAPDECISLNSLINNPALFHFSLPTITGSRLGQVNKNLLLENYSIDREYIKLKRFASLIN
jgi:hypothetical protein